MFVTDFCHCSNRHLTPQACHTTGSAMVPAEIQPTVALLSKHSAISPQATDARLPTDR